MFRLNNSWSRYLSSEFEKKYFIDLLQIIKQDNFFPPEDMVFNALNLTPLENVKVVILGQDPYHGENQAHGLAFSVQNDVSIPPSLRNIFKEIEDDLQLIIDKNNGNLSRWARQGVLLLNTVLTVKPNSPNSHKELGWEIFTDKVIGLINEQKRGVVFILWGANAKRKKVIIDENKHLIITSPHPSPLSANRGFFGSRPFSKTNNYLESLGIIPIDWR